MARYLNNLHIAAPPELSYPLPSNAREEERLYDWLREHEDPSYFHFSTMSGGRLDMVWKPHVSRWRSPTDWRQLFAESLRDALRTAVDYAGGVTTQPGDHKIGRAHV